MPQIFNILLLVTLLLKYGNAVETKFATECLTPNNKVGVCIEIQSCFTLIKQVEDNKRESFDFIRASHCGPSNEDISRPKVCCGPDINFIKDAIENPENVPLESTSAAAAFTDTVRTTTVTSPSVVSRNILPIKCGQQKIFLSNRIFGGTEADVGEFPWLARLVHFNKYNKTRLGCSGFLIHRKFVLTAAHCLVGRGMDSIGELESVILGMHNDTKARICTSRMCTDPPRRVEVLRPIIHEGYDSNTHNHDIALIPLKEKINFTDFIQAICLPQTSTNASILTISGWGRTERDTSSKAKLKVDLPRVDRTICNKKYKSLGLSISDMQLCAGGESGQDSCAGDSGGPLMAPNAEQRWFAEGIVSYGNSCGREDWPGVYTNIPSYYDWIVGNIRTVTRMYRNKVE